MQATIGRGRRRPQGERRVIDENGGRVRALQQFMNGLSDGEEAWVSFSVYDGDYRKNANFESCDAIGIDCDWGDKNVSITPATGVEALRARMADMPGSLFHWTPHGARVVFVLDSTCTDALAGKEAGFDAAYLVQAVVDGTGYKVDIPVCQDMARFYYTPRSKAKGIQRDAVVELLREQPYALLQLHEAAAPLRPAAEPELPPEPAAAPVASPSVSFSEAAERWIHERGRRFPPPGSTQCPICCEADGCECFGRLGDDDTKWSCFNTDHPQSVGKQHATGWYGDGLDLEAALRGCKPVDVLRQDGYLPRLSSLPGGGGGAGYGGAAAGQAGVAVGGAGEAGGAPGGDGGAPSAWGQRPWISNDYHTTVEILRQDASGIRAGMAIELNEMTFRVELGRRPLTDAREAILRERFTRLFCVNSKTGRGMVQKPVDITAACAQLAQEKRYHPVRDYLHGLEWDGTERIAYLPDLLCAERNTLNQALVKRWLVGCVARAFEPGCKLDTVLILRGNQGLKKSWFFAVMGGDWFRDAGINIKNKDALMIMRNAWIYEWGELGTMRRHDIDEVKDFVTHRTDSYRPPWGRHEIDVPRTTVFVGTTNREDFLVDDENRRWWVVAVRGEIDLDAVCEQRDQLWAEAVRLYRQGEPWHITAEEKVLLESTQIEYQDSDPWAAPVLHWLLTGPDEFTTADVMDLALKKPIGQWSTGDARRLATILKRAGYIQNKRLAKRPWRRGLHA